jgi:hypothetical protein
MHNKNENGKKPTHDREDRTRFEMTREETRLDREGLERDRDGAYDMPDYDNFDYDNITAGKLHLIAPIPRVDPKNGKMVQYWADCLRNNGGRILELKEKGYVIRDPKTVPLSFRSFTQQWQMTDVIMVAGRHILMEAPEFHHKKMQRKKHEKNEKNIREIQSTHGQVIRDGEVMDYRDRDAGAFSKEVIATRNYGGEGEGLSFAD